MTRSGDLLSTGQAAKLLNVTPDTVLKWIKQGRMPAVQTAGGHHRIARSEVSRLLAEPADASARSSVPGLVYCWEYYAENGEINHRCEACVVYRARALRCYEMSSLPPEAGFSGTHCTTTCGQCPYYRELVSKPPRVLIVTDNARLKARLLRERATSHLHIEFAECAYDCSTAVQSFKPEVVVIDCSLRRHNCHDLCAKLANDPRLPGVKVYLASDGADAAVEHPTADPGAHRLVRFTLAELEHDLCGPLRLEKEVKIKRA